MTPSMDDIDDLVVDIDPSKVSVDVQPRYLDRQIVITIDVSDDKTFVALAKAAEILKEAYQQELLHLHSKP